MVTPLLLAAALIAQGDAEAAKSAFDKAKKYFDIEEFEAALPHFQEAYRLSGKRPSTVFALAQCERALKMFGEAITHFREYLATSPPDAAQIEETIALLEELRARERAASPPPPPPPRAPAPPPDPIAVAPPPPAPEPEADSVLSSPIFWIVAGAVVVAGAVTVGVVATSGEEDPYGGTVGLVLSP